MKVKEHKWFYSIYFFVMGFSFLALLYMVISLLCLSGCSQRSGDASSGVSSSVVSNVPSNSATMFQNMKLKVKTDVLYPVNGIDQKVIIELYVDEDGDGEGLLGFGDYIYNLVISANKIYIKVSSTDIIYVSDINARGYFSDITATTIEDMNGVGFKFTDGFPTSFDGKKGDLTVRTQYAQSTNDYGSIRVSDDNAKTLQEAVQYIIDINGGDSTGDASTGGTSTGPTTFYVDSEYGVTIDGFNYSIGDTCNPDDYCAGLTPEGFLYSDEYKEDTKITFTHISYISSTGRTTFSTTSDYVQAIQTNADFEFRGFYRGMDTKEVKLALGYKLSKKEAEGNEVFDETIIVDQFKSNTYYCHTETLNIEFRINKDGLSEIYVSRPLRFM